MLVEIKILKLEAAQLFAPEATKQGQREKYLPPQRGVYKRIQERLSLLHGVALLLLSGIQRRQRDGSAQGLYWSIPILIA